MMLYAAKAFGYVGVFDAPTQAAAIKQARELADSVSLRPSDFNTSNVLPATEGDLDWVRMMGGRIT
jgi:hypothetical protein